MMDRPAAVAWHLCSNRWNSAVTEYAISTAKAFRLLGFRSIFTATPESPAAKRAAAAGLEVALIKSFDWNQLGTLRALAKRIQPGVVVLNGGPETTLSQFFGVSGRCKFIRVRGVDFEDGLGFKLKHKLSHRHIDQVVVPGHDLGTKLGKTIGKRVTPITLGVDARVFTPDTTSRRASKPSLMVFGRLDPVKGHERLMKLFKQVRGRWPTGTPSPILEIIGEPANISAEQIRAVAQALALVPDIDWKLTDKRIDNVAKIMSGAAVGVVPSLGSELICRVAEEFLLCGTPVAVSGVGSLNEVLFDDTAGFSFKNMNDEAIVTNLLNWLSRSLHESTQDKLERAAKAKARFSIEAMAQSYAVLLKRL